MAKKILKTVGKVAKVAGLGAIGNALLGKKKPKAADPVVTEPVMPTPDDEAVKLARKRSIAAQLNRGGRSSTILSDDTDSLGGY